MKKRFIVILNDSAKHERKITIFFKSGRELKDIIISSEVVPEENGQTEIISFHTENATGKNHEVNHPHYFYLEDIEEITF